MTLVSICVILLTCVITLGGIMASPLDENKEDVIENRIDINFNECKDDCDSRADCFDVNYYNKYKLCQLLTVHHPVQKIGIMNYSKSKLLIQKQTNACADCYQPNECRTHQDEDYLRTECLIRRCPKPRLAGARVDGNIYTVGSKLKVQCVATDDYVIIRCLASGNWSEHSLTCSCRPPVVRDGHVRLSRVSEGVVQAGIVCQGATTLVNDVKPRCNTTTEEWLPSFDTVCCDVVYDGAWQKIVRYQGGKKTPIIDWWKPNPGETLVAKKHCTYRNVSILSDWDGAIKLSRVKLDVIKNEQIVAYITFNATETTSMTWFARDKILASSWKDLTSSTDYMKFSIAGQKLNNGLVRFFIAKTVSEYDCNVDQGWLAFGRNSYPCNVNGMNMDVVNLVYSNTTATFMTRDNVDIADRFEVLVEKLPDTPTLSISGFFDSEL